MCACLHELFSAATALSLDGWSFSSACSCLMNPAFHVLIECFLCSHVHSPPPLPTNPHPSLVCEIGRWRLMNKGSLTSHTSYEASGANKQTNSDTHSNTHLLTRTRITQRGRKGKASRVTFASKMLTFLSSCWLHPFLGKALENHQQVRAHGGELVLEMPSFLRHSPH